MLKRRRSQILLKGRGSVPPPTVEPILRAMKPSLKKVVAQIWMCSFSVAFWMVLKQNQQEINHLWRPLNKDTPRCSSTMQRDQATYLVCVFIGVNIVGNQFQMVLSKYRAKSEREQNM